MAADPGTVEWWRDRLLDQFINVDRPKRLEMLDVYDAKQPLATTTTDPNGAFRELLRASRTPWGRLIVDTTAERLECQGFRLEGDEPDERVWRTMLRNRIPTLQGDTFKEALASGTSYMSVVADEAGLAKVVPESSLCVSHEFKAGSVDEVAAAIKVWADKPAKLWHCVVFLPDVIVQFDAQYVDGMEVPRGSVWRQTAHAPNGTGIVSIVPFVCRRDWWGQGRSELADLRPLFDRFERVTFDMLVASSFGAFRQRWATGLEIPIDPETGQEVEPFKVAVDRLWVSEDDETKFGSFDSTDLGPYLKAQSAIVAEIAAISRVPSSYFVQPDLVNPPSADSYEASEVNLISKVRGFHGFFGDSLEQVAMLAMRVEGQEGVDLGQIETIWRDPRARSESQTMDAAQKMSVLGVPFEVVAEFMGYSPTEVDRMLRLRTRDQLMAALQAPAPVVQQGGQVEDGLVDAGSG